MTGSNRHAFTLVELLVAITIGVYLCMLGGMVLIAVQRSVSSIENLASAQGAIRLACERGSLQRLVPEAFPAQQFSARMVAVRGALRPMHATTISYAAVVAGTTYPTQVQSQWLDYYGVINPVQVTGLGSSVSNLTGRYAGKTVFPLTLRTPAQLFDGRRMGVIDPVRGLFSFQDAGVVNAAYTTATVYAVDDSAQAAPLNLISSSGSGDVPHLKYGERMHLVVPAL